MLIHPSVSLILGSHPVRLLSDRMHVEPMLTGLEAGDHHLDRRGTTLHAQQTQRNQTERGETQRGKGKAQRGRFAQAREDGLSGGARAAESAACGSLRGCNGEPLDRAACVGPLLCLDSNPLPLLHACVLAARCCSAPCRIRSAESDLRLLLEQHGASDIISLEDGDGTNNGGGGRHGGGGERREKERRCEQRRSRPWKSARCGPTEAHSTPQTAASFDAHKNLCIRVSALLYRICKGRFHANWTGCIASAALCWPTSPSTLLPSPLRESPRCLPRVHSGTPSPPSSPQPASEPPRHHSPTPLHTRRHHVSNKQAHAAPIGCSSSTTAIHRVTLAERQLLSSAADARHSCLRFCALSPVCDLCCQRRGCGNSTPAAAAYAPAEGGANPAASPPPAVKKAQPRAPTFSQMQEAHGSGMSAADPPMHSRTATSAGARSIAEECSDADLHLYEEVVIDTVPRPIVVLPWAHVLDPAVIAKAIRVMETPQQVRELLAGGVVLLSKEAEEIQAREQTAAEAMPTSPPLQAQVVKFAEAAVLAEEDEDLPVSPQPPAGRSLTLGPLFAVLARIYTLWNTPSAIPHLAFNPDIKRGSIIGGQAGLGISPLMPPAKAPGSRKSPASAAATAPAAAAGAEVDFLGSPVSPLPPAAPTPQTQGIKPDNKPAYVGEMIAFLKVWEGELLAEQEAYTRPSNQALLAAALESLHTYEQLLSVAVTRGTFLRSMYAVQDQFLLHREREQVVQKIRERIKRRKTYQPGAFTTAALKNPARASLNSSSVSSFPPSSLMIDRPVSVSINAVAAAAAAVSATSPAADSAEAELMKRFATMADTLASHAVLQHCFSPLDFTCE